MEYGPNKNNRFPADERVIFERLWRGALCQAFGAKAPLAGSRRARACCCHCQCGNAGGVMGHQVAVPPRKALRSVVR